MTARMIDGYLLHFDRRERISISDSALLRSLGLKYCPRCQRVKARSEFHTSNRPGRTDNAGCNCKRCAGVETAKYARSYATRANYINSNARRRQGETNRVTGSQIKARLELYEFRCAYCGTAIQDDYELDHIMPVSRGGKNVIENIAPVCLSCNRSKYDRTVEEWIQEMRTRLEWMERAHSTT